MRIDFASTDGCEIDDMAPVGIRALICHHWFNL